MPAQPDIAAAPGPSPSPARADVAAAEPNERLPLATLVVYGLPSVALTMMGTFVGMYLLMFVTDTLLVPAAVFSIAFAVSRVWDGISDPIVGFLSDSTRSRMGRRRSWIAWGAVPLALAFFALWSPPTLGSTAIIVWTAAAIVLFYTCSTVIAVPHMAWGAELSLNYQERNRVFGSRALFDIAGVLLAAAAISLLESAHDERAMGTMVAIAAGILAVSLLTFCVTRLQERPEFQERGPSRPDSALLDVFKNRYARMLLAVFFVDSLGFGCLMVLFPYMAKYAFGEGASAGLFIGVTMGVALVSFPLWFSLSKRFGKRNPWIAANIVKAIVFAMMYWMDPEEVWLLWTCVILIGAVQPAGMILAPSIKADVIDYDEYQTGQRKEGTYFATFNLASKSASALAILVSGAGLSLIGYEPNVDQGAEVIGMLRILFSALPCALHIVGLVVLFRFDFNEEAHARVRSALEARPENRASRNPPRHP